jgi:predicted RNase H-related nuclease YkuK (DUF458 family)
MKVKNLVFAGLFLISGTTIVSAQVNLSFNPEKGKKYEYRQEMIQNIKQNMMGQEIPMETEMNVTYLMEIMDVKAEEIHTQFTYKEFAYIISSPMMKMGYDSKNPVEDPTFLDQLFGSMFGTLIDKPFTVIIAPDGSIKSVTGMKEIVDSMVGETGNDQMASQIGGQMKMQFNDDAMKNMLEQSFKIYPDRAVKKGDSWNLQSTTEINNINVLSKTKYILKDVSKNTAIVLVESEIAMKPGESMEGNLAGTQTGTISIDPKTGMTLSGETTQIIKGVMQIQGFEVQLDINSKTKIATKEVK